MAKQPFIHMETGNIIAKFVRDDLLPLEKELVDNARLFARLRVGVREAILRRHLAKCEELWAACQAKLADCYAKFNDPDRLLSGLNEETQKRAAAEVAATYLSFDGVVRAHFARMFTLAEYAERLLMSRSQRADFIVTMLVAGLALVISIFSIVR